MLLAVGATLPAVAVRLAGIHPAPLVTVGIFGLSILGAGFLLSWGAGADPASDQPTSDKAPPKARCCSGGCVRQLRGFGTRSAGATSAWPLIRLRHAAEVVIYVRPCIAAPTE